MGPRPIGLNPGSGYQSGLVDDMFPLPSSETQEAELSIDTGISESRDTIVSIISRT